MQTQAIIRHIVQWLKDYAEQARAKGFVVGVSGGIDSAVVSTLAAQTGLSVLLLEMPIRQKSDQVNRAQEHMSRLKQRYPNVKAQSVDLTQTFDTFADTVDVSETEFPNKQLALANARSRLRMTTLYYYGQLHGLLVAGTGNKIEDFGVGFFTKYGDGGVDISPIADLTKTQVYALAAELDVSEDIQKAVPTDGLWDTERTDEEQMGASYPELEWAMSVYNSHKPEDLRQTARSFGNLYPIAQSHAAQSQSDSGLQDSGRIVLSLNIKRSSENAGLRFSDDLLYFISIRIGNMLEKQHHQIPKQCSGRRAQQYPRADFGDFPNGALLFATEQTVHNQCRYGAKEKKSQKPANHSTFSQKYCL